MNPNKWWKYYFAQTAPKSISPKLSINSLLKMSCSSKLICLAIFVFLIIEFGFLLHLAGVGQSNNQCILECNENCGNSVEFICNSNSTFSQNKNPQFDHQNCQRINEEFKAICLNSCEEKCAKECLGKCEQKMKSKNETTNLSWIVQGRIRKQCMAECGGMENLY